MLNRTIVENRSITYPLYCNMRDTLAEFLKRQGKIWFDAQAALIDKQKDFKPLSSPYYNYLPSWPYYNPKYSTDQTK